MRKTLTALLLMLFVLFFTLSGCESHKNVPDEKTDKTLAEERILIAENTAEEKTDTDKVSERIDENTQQEDIKINTLTEKADNNADEKTDIENEDKTNIEKSNKDNADKKTAEEKKTEENKNTTGNKESVNKKETAKKETAKKETAKKETAKKETAKKETAKKESSKKTDSTTSQKQTTAKKTNQDIDKIMEELEKEAKEEADKFIKEQEEQWAKAERKVIVTVKEDLEQKAFNEINKIRKAAGANPLKWSASAAQQARKIMKDYAETYKRKGEITTFSSFESPKELTKEVESMMKSVVEYTATIGDKGYVDTSDLEFAGYPLITDNSYTQVGVAVYMREDVLIVGGEKEPLFTEYWIGIIMK